MTPRDSQQYRTDRTRRKSNREMGHIKARETRQGKQKREIWKTTEKRDRARQAVQR